jgi:hypothetical protein
MTHDDAWRPGLSATKLTALEVADDAISVYVETVPDRFGLLGRHL